MSKITRRQNTRRPPVEIKEIDVASNTKHQSIQRKYWAFTLNRDVETEIITYQEVINWIKSKNVSSYTFQLERGETGYIHYQGHFELNGKGKRLETLKIGMDKVHLEPSRSIAAKEYARKVTTRLAGPWVFPYIYKGEDLPRGEDLYPWQKQILEEIKGPVIHRKITWLYDPIGNTGKSTFAKYMAYHHDAIVCGGELKDIAFAVTQTPTKEKPIFLFDIVRSHGNRISYAALEALSNGMFFSPKYESKPYLGPRPFIYVFANREPEFEELSNDRWNVIKIEKTEPTHELNNLVATATPSGETTLSSPKKLNRENAAVGEELTLILNWD